MRSCLRCSIVSGVTHCLIDAVRLIIDHLVFPSAAGDMGIESVLLPLHVQQTSKHINNTGSTQSVPLY